MRIKLTACFNSIFVPKRSVKNYVCGRKIVFYNTIENKNKHRHFEIMLKYVLHPKHLKYTWYLKVTATYPWSASERVYEFILLIFSKNACSFVLVLILKLVFGWKGRWLPVIPRSTSCWKLSTLLPSDAENKKNRHSHSSCWCRGQECWVEAAQQKCNCSKDFW